MKKKFNMLFVSLLVMTLFVGCSMSGPAMSTITLSCGSYGTATLSSSSAPLGSFVTVTTTPNAGYYASSVDTEGYGSETITDKNDENVFYVYVNKDKVKISVSFSEKNTYAIYDETILHGTISCKKSRAYNGQVVEFTVESDNYYHTKSVSVLPYWSTDSAVEATQDEEDSTKYTFVMPKYPVKLSAEFEEYIVFEADKEIYTIGDELKFSIHNYSEFSSGDLYYSYANEDYLELIQADFDLSSDSYSFTPTEAGVISLYIKNPNDTSKYHKAGTYTVNIKNLPDNMKTISCHKVSSEDSSTYTKKSNTYKFVTDKKENIYYVDYKYYYESNPSKIINGSKSFSNYSFTIELEYSYEENDTIIFQFNDSSEHIISDKIRIAVPKYPDTPLTNGSKKLPYHRFYCTSTEFNSLNCVIEAGGEDYFTAVIASSELVITSKKTTGKDWKITLKDASGNVKGIVNVNIPYSGNPDVEIIE